MLAGRQEQNSGLRYKNSLIRRMCPLMYLQLGTDSAYLCICYLGTEVISHLSKVGLIYLLILFTWQWERVPIFYWNVLRSGPLWYLRGKEFACNAGDRFNTWVKIPWIREWLLTPVFLPEEFHGQRSLVGYSPWGCKESDTTEQLTLSLSFNV